MQREQSRDQGIEAMKSVGMIGTCLRKFLLKNGIILFFLFAWGQAKFNLGDFDNC